MLLREESSTSRVITNESFEGLVEDFLPPIYNFLLRSIQDADEASELSQEVFFKVWKSRAAYDSKQSFKSWIFAIAHNTLIDFLRKKKPLIFSSLDTEEVAFEETLVDEEQLAHELFDTALLVQELDRSLTALPQEQQEIISLHITEHLTFEEISRILKKPMHTIKSNYRRALLRLKKEMSDSSAPK